MLRVGLTGGIGSGKTAAADFFARLGVPVIDSDEIAHRLVQPGSQALAAIADQFGADIIDDNGELDRGQLAQIVFADSEKKQQLERILHPRVYETIQQRLTELTHSDSDYVIVVVPLLFEAGFTDLVDRILVLDCDDQIRIERIQARDGRSVEDIEMLMHNQLERHDRLRRADDIVDNSGSLEDLGNRVAELHQLYSDTANQ